MTAVSTDHDGSVNSISSEKTKSMVGLESIPSHVNNDELDLRDVLRFRKIAETEDECVYDVKGLEFAEIKRIVEDGEFEGKLEWFGDSDMLVQRFAGTAKAFTSTWIIQGYGQYFGENWLYMSTGHITSATNSFVPYFLAERSNDAHQKARVMQVGFMPHWVLEVEWDPPGVYCSERC